MIYDFSMYEEIGLGDRVLDKRVRTALEQLSKKPGESILKSCGDVHQAKAIYRLTSNEKFTPQSVMRVGHAETIDAIRKSGKKVVLVAQDTTEVNYSNLKETEGLGTTGNSKESRGLFVHTAMCVSENGETMGLLSQKIWMRPIEEYGKKAERKQLPIEEKESIKWLETLEKSDIGILPGVEAVHICDREGDIYELFDKAEKEKQLFLCRRVQNRRVTEESGTLKKYIEELPVEGTYKLSVPRDSHSKRKAREAEIEVKYGKVNIKKSKSLCANKTLLEDIEVYVISAEEISAPEGVKPLSWQLITNVPTNTLEEALKRISWYTHRWKIELFHRVLKDGCKIEELQATKAEKLRKLIALYSIIAVKIMILKGLLQEGTEVSCEEYFQEYEWEILYRVGKKTKVVPKDPPSIREMILLIAKLGGFAGRKGDGEPGVAALWSGLTTFSSILDAYPFLS